MNRLEMGKMSTKMYLATILFVDSELTEFSTDIAYRPLEPGINVHSIQNQSP